MQGLFAVALFLTFGGEAQTTLVVDRQPGAGLASQPIERVDGGFFGDSFRIGAKGEVWMIDAIRVWFRPAQGGSCGRELGDSIDKITFFGALDNPPVPGQPACDCHALIAIATVPLERGSSRTLSPNASLTKENGLWRLDLKQARWSIPGDADAVFSLRATARDRSKSCPVESGWSVATVPQDAAGYRLHLLDRKGVPAGLAERESARPIAIQVWANRWK